MIARRSESCPRPARRESTPLAPPPPPALVPVRSCTLQDLGPEDRQKVAKLLKQVVDLGQEVQQLKQQRDEQAKAFNQREQDLQDANRQLHTEQQTLKKKLGQVLLVLRASQAKVNALEAAQQAVREAQRTAQVQTDPMPAAWEGAQATTSGAAPCSNASAQAAPTTHASMPLATAMPGGAPVAEPSGEEPTAPSGGTRGSEHPGAQPASAQPAPIPASTQPLADVAAALGASGLRSSLSAPAGIPHLLHVAPGAHVNITINHAPEPAGIITAMPATGPTPAPASATPPQRTESPLPEGAQEAPTCRLADSTDGAVGAAASHDAMPSGAQGATVIAIPTSTAAAAAASVVASNTSSGAAAPEHVAGCQSPLLALAGIAGAVAQRAMAAAGTQKAPGGVGAGQGLGRPARPRNILVDATMQQFEAVPVHEVVVDSQEAPLASPVIVQPSEEVVAAACSLLGWQAKHDLVRADGNGRALPAGPLPPHGASAAGGVKNQRGGRKVLSYDPAIGQSGAFYFVDVADDMAEPPAAAGVGHAGQSAALASVNLPGTGVRTHVANAGGGVVPPAGLCEESTATRPESCGHADARCARPKPGPSMPPSGSQRVAAQQRPPPNRQLLPSPCGSTMTESTAVLTPSLHATASPYGLDTPCGSAASLSRMAVVLDEVAWQRRWDLQPPPGVQQQEGQAEGRAMSHHSLAGRAPHGAPQAQEAYRVQESYAGNGGYDSSIAGRQGCQPRQQGLRGPVPHPHASTRASSGFGVGVRLFDVPPDVVPLESLSACGSSAGWHGTSDLIDRYDESFVDILSQADEEMDQQSVFSQAPPSRPRQAAYTKLVAAGAGVPITARSKAAAHFATFTEAAAVRTKQKVASLEALLAANIYEENDVLSVILEQEDNS